MQKKLTTIVCAVTHNFLSYKWIFEFCLRRGYYFSYFTWQPEQPKLPTGDRFAGGCNVVKRSWKMGNESFIADIIAFFLRCCSSLSESLHGLKCNCWLCRTWLMIYLKNNPGYWARCHKKNWGSLQCNKNRAYWKRYVNLLCNN